MQSKYIPCILFLLILLFSCGTSDKPYTIEYKDGVKYVHNHTPLWGDTLKVALEFVQKIGDLETLDENFQLFNPSDVVRDNEGNVFILDSGNFRVQKYNRNGEFIKSLGRKGPGPGEFGDALYDMNLGVNNDLYIFDIMRELIHIFSTEGKYVNQVRLSESGLGYRVFSSGELIFQNPIPVGLPKMPLDKHILSVLDPEKETAKGFGNKFKIFSNTNEADAANVLMNRVVFDIDNENNIFSAYTCLNVIEKYSSDLTLELRFDRPLNFKVNENPKNGRETTDVSMSLTCDDKERIWISTANTVLDMGYNNWDSKYFNLEIFNQDGVLLGSIPQPDLGKIRIYGDMLYIIDTGIEMCVYVYKIVEK